jgi:hypothetical protein
MAGDNQVLHWTPKYDAPGKKVERFPLWIIAGAI